MFVQTRAKLNGKASARHSEDSRGEGGTGTGEGRAASEAGQRQTSLAGRPAWRTGPTCNVETLALAAAGGVGGAGEP
jgi:hypothetical protein